MIVQLLILREGVILELRHGDESIILFPLLYLLLFFTISKTDSSN